GAAASGAGPRHRPRRGPRRRLSRHRSRPRLRQPRRRDALRPMARPTVRRARPSGSRHVRASRPHAPRHLPPTDGGTVSNDPTPGLRAPATPVYIAERWAALPATLEPGRRGGSSVHTAPESTPPLALYVSDLMHEIETEARSLAHVLMDETDWTPPTSHMPGLLSAVAERYGHWTSGDEHTALEFCDWAET